jgi:hypothetical protein
MQNFAFFICLIETPQYIYLREEIFTTHLKYKKIQEIEQNYLLYEDKW